MADVISARVVAAEPLSWNVRHAIAQVQGPPRPLFAFSYETAEDPNGSRSEGRPGMSPKKRIIVKVRNTGPGTAMAMTATLKNGPGQQGVLIDVGRFKSRRLGPGETVTCSFSYASDSGRGPEPYKFDLTIGDDGLRDWTTHRISFEGGGAGAAAGQVTPPTVSVSAPMVVTTPTVRLTGDAAAEGGLRDIFVTVQDLAWKRLPQKVFYLASPGGQSRVPFTADVPLRDGSNYIRVTARAADGVPTTTSLIVLRPPRQARTPALTGTGN
jgi:hypothetical protein